MKRGRHSVDMGNLQRNRKNNHPSSRKCKGHIESSSQSRNDFEKMYDRRDAMSDAQLQELLAQRDGHFYQQQEISDIEEELEDEDAEKEDPVTAEDEQDGSQTPDDDTPDKDEPGSSQPGKKNEFFLMKNNFKKWKKTNSDKWLATCNHCNKNISLEISQGYGGAHRHVKAHHPVEYAKLKGKGTQTQISRFANGQPYSNFSYSQQETLDTKKAR
ncbi:unnamed protein product [Cuscuta europaea]|uniref:BED-type domain-containing protein n=1 Tax=Cuscuta europaea TaxID=41803 RepID=A0A9P0YYK6_CUSEU|nr:unnamed protein product [Cuscuta europaea]